MNNVGVWMLVLCLGTAAAAQDGGVPQPLEPAAAPEAAPPSVLSEEEAVSLRPEEVPDCSDEAAPPSPVCDVLEDACGKPIHQSSPACKAFVERILLRGVPDSFTASRAPAAVAPAAVPLPAPPESLLKAIEDCLDKENCDTLQDLEQRNKNGFLSIQLWCRRNSANVFSSFSTAVSKVCRAAWNADSTRIAKIARVDMALFLEQVKEPAFECGGFGLTLPLFSVRRSGGDYEVNGPVAAGVGGGYYHALKCRETWTWGPEVFAFTEGLDPSKTFQVGVAAGLSVTAFKYFNFGLAVGYDLFRHQNLEDGSRRSSGLLTGKDLNKENLTWLITFGVKNASEKKTEGDSDDEGSATATTPNGNGVSGSGSD